MTLPPPWCDPRTLGALEPVSGGLRAEDGTLFPVVSGIPRFVPNDGYAESFGRQWLRYRRTQLDSHTGHPVTRERLRRCLGERAWGRLQGAQVLECGCGAGRFTEVLLAEGACVTSIDLSSAVDANATNFPPSDRHRVAQADILALPFAGEQFDVVLCLGVVQHTPSPEATIAALAHHVRPGGLLAIDHYPVSIGWTLSLKPLYRALLLRQPPERRLETVDRLVARFLPWHRRLRHSRIASSLLGRVSPVLCYYRDLPMFSDELQYEWALLDTHDALTDRYKHRRTVAELARTVRELGFAEVEAWEGGNGVELRAIRGDGTRSDQPVVGDSQPSDGAMAPNVRFQS